MKREQTSHPVQRWNIRLLTVSVLALVVMAGLMLAYTPQRPAEAAAETPTMGDMPKTRPTVPAVKGFTEGQEILFVHTEASDPKVAKMLTDMMHSLVLVVPSLGQVPEDKLVNVYVFTNGIRGGGPFGFKADVFDKPAGTEGYTPLRALNLVAWKNGQGARLLKSVAEVNQAVARDEVTTQRPGVVVNMPMLTWPGGHRDMGNMDPMPM